MPLPSRCRRSAIATTPTAGPGRPTAATGSVGARGTKPGRSGRPRGAGPVNEQYTQRVPLAAAKPGDVIFYRMNNGTGLASERD